MQATKSTITDWEQFNKTGVVDLYQALIAFGQQHPNMIKLSNEEASYPYIWPGNAIEHVSADIVTGVHYWYWVDPNFAYDPKGLPGYDRNETEMVGDWEYWSCRETIPYYNSVNTPGAPNMLWWVSNILRTKRYASPNIVESTDRRFTTAYKLTNGCGTSYIGTNNYGGRRSIGVLRNYANTNSAISMGSRWVVDIQLTDDSAPGGNGETWTLDLGPAVGTFAPEFGIVQYSHVPTWTIVYSNLQDKDGNANWQSIWYDNYPMPCNR
jgi:hypothetical protein